MADTVDHRVRENLAFAGRGLAESDGFDGQYLSQVLGSRAGDPGFHPLARSSVNGPDLVDVLRLEGVGRSGALAYEVLAPAILADKEVGYEPANVLALATDRHVQGFRILVEVGAPTAGVPRRINKKKSTAPNGD